MRLSTDFSGRIIQITEALDRYDAVSNQVVRIDSIFKSLGLDSIIGSKWSHPDCDDVRTDLSSITTSERDVVIFHFYGHHEHALKWLDAQYCTKIVLYHNITPKYFFKHDKEMAKFCHNGRNQLRNYIDKFHYYWGDSQYNVDELIALGADPARTAVIPIIIPHISSKGHSNRKKGRWAFVGRVAPNKGVLELVQLFNQVHSSTPDLANDLVVIGSASESDAYCREVFAAIKASGLSDRIRLTGKIHDDERDALLQTADVYMSLSEHEGFGVPLVEAALHNLPVIALDRAAVRETLGDSQCLAADAADLVDHLASVSLGGENRDKILASQLRNSLRFTPEAVSEQLILALNKVLPKKNHFKTLSVVICTYNRWDLLDRCLEYLRYQSSEDFEVIVVNGPSNDRTDEILEKYKGRIKVVLNPERNLSKSRNLGIDCAAGDIVAFIDDDAIPFDDWVQTILKEYNSRPLQTAGLGGPAYYAGSFWFQAEDNGIDLDCQVKVNISTDEIGKNGWLRYNTGTNATFSRLALQDICGFDEQYDYFLDESELCVRLQQAGSLIGYAPEVYVRHEFAQSHNRQGKLNYNWFTICKNTAYFIATHSGRTGKTLTSYIDERMRKERIAPIEQALKDGEINKDEASGYIAAIWSGVKQGLADAKSWPKTRAIKPKPSDFLRYSVDTNRAAVLRDVKSLHICIVSKEIPPFAASGGVGTLYYHLVSELILMGHRVSLIVPSGENRVHTQGRLKVYFTKELHFDLPPLDGGFSANICWSLSVLTQLASIGRSDPIDVVDCALWDAEGLAFSLLDRDRRPPLVVRLVTPYAISAEINNWGPSAEQLTQFMSAERRLIEGADGVIPISNSIGNSIANRYQITPDQRWSQGYCGIAYWPAFDVNEGYNNFPELDGFDTAKLAKSKIVLFVGRLERRKGIDLIHRAAAPILEADEDALLVIAGRDPTDWASRFNADMPAALRRRVILLGEVSNATREKLMAYAYCLLFPSRYESFGLVPLEAFVHGVPVVACEAGAISEVIEDGKSGLLFKGDDAMEMAGHVSRLLKEPSLRAEMSEHAKHRVRQLSSRKSALHTLDVYMSIFSRRNLNSQKDG